MSAETTDRHLWAVTTGGQTEAVTDLTHEPPAGLGAGDIEEHGTEETTTGEPVDPPAVKLTATERLAAAKAANVQPVLPELLSDWQTAKATMRWAVRYYRQRLAYRAVRVPADLARWCGWVTLGLALLVKDASLFLADLEGRQALKEADSRTTLLMQRHRKEQFARRAKGVAFLATLTTVAAAALYWFAPTWLQLAALVAAVAGLGWRGKPADKPMLTGASVAKTTAPRLTSAAISAALGGLGIAALNQAVAKGRTSEMFPKPIVRTKTGWLAEIDLPYGVTAQEVGERRAKLASGLRRQSGAVWPESCTSTHEGRLRLFVLDAPLSQLPQPAWPLAKSGKADIFKSLPYGYDPKGDPVALDLMYSNLLVGAIPRQGKSFSVRVVVLGAALDPIVEIHAVELKGTGDFEAVEALAHRYVSGPARDIDLQQTMASIREVHSYLEPRALTIAKLPAPRCPQKKVTRALADDRALRLHPVLLAIDEVQELFESEYAAEAEQLLKAVIKRGPALGIILVLSTQKPDAKSLPTSISSNMGLRLCLRVADQMANDMVLGTSSYRIGINATLFTDADKGVALLRDGGASATTVRAAYLDGADALRIGRRALALRTVGEYLSGDAVGQRSETDADRMSVVVDAVAVWAQVPNADDSAWLSDIEATLSQAYPDTYAGLTGSWLGARLRALGIPVKAQRFRRVDGKDRNTVGVDLAALRSALEAPIGVTPDA